MTGACILVYAIGDLHLSISREKPMSVFGSRWENHTEKIKKNWESVVGEGDVCVIPGDISWAMKLKDALPDLEFIKALPGKKVLLPGNHDFWWGSTALLNEMYKSCGMVFIKNSFTAYGDLAICGGRGWLCPNDTLFLRHDMKIYRRELIRIETSLKQASDSGYTNILLAVHYPPTNDKKEYSDFMGLIEKYAVKCVVYGHLHGNYSFNAGLTGIRNGCEFFLVSADYLDFKPKILPYSG